MAHFLQTPKFSGAVADIEHFVTDCVDQLTNCFRLHLATCVTGTKVSHSLIPLVTGKYCHGFSSSIPQRHFVLVAIAVVNRVLHDR
jgi:hypothetical protein